MKVPQSKDGFSSQISLLKSELEFDWGLGRQRGRGQKRFADVLYSCEKQA
jgi:hypothetical protein